MPPIEIPEGFSQIALVHDIPGSHGEVIVTWAITNDDTEADDLREVMDNWQDNVVEQFFTTNVTFVEGRSLRGPRPGTPTLSLLANPLKPTVGAQDNNALPVNNAVLISTSTALGGRSYRGRKYMPGVPEEAVDNQGNLDPAAQAQFQTAIDVFFAELLTDGLPPVILHSPTLVQPVTDPPTYNPPPVPTPITAMTVQRKMATQRTRLRG